MSNDRDDFGPKAAATGLLVAAAAGALYLEPSWPAWGDGFARVTSLGLCLGVVATVLAVFRAGPFARRCISAALLLAVSGFLLARLGGYQTRAPVWTDLRYVSVLFAAVTGAAVGLIAQRRWARWLAMSLAFAGSSTALINLVMRDFEPGWSSWRLGVFAIGSALVLTNLAGRTMARSDAADARDFSQAWPTRVRPVWWLRAAVIASLVATPMLVLYAWVQPGAVETYKTPAVLTALALAGSTILVIRGRAIGALLLGAAGAALIVLACFVLGGADVAYEQRIAFYYLPFWLPAGVAATVSGVILSRAALSRPVA